MTQDAPSDIDPDRFVDQLYDIALDPEALEPFIDAWNAAGLDASAAREMAKLIDGFDKAYAAHLTRAETFLARGTPLDEGPNLAAILTPFEDLAAFIVDPALHVVASNRGAQQTFGIPDTAELSALHLPLDAQTALHTALTSLFTKSQPTERLLNLQLSDDKAPAIFQIRGLINGSEPQPLHALVVTTKYHWQEALGQSLQEVFNLTAAEQGVVRALVEGLDTKGIAAERDTSEGTVRGQIKSILSKMNARNQSEVIRLVLSLRDVSAGAASAARPPVARAAPDTPPNWLDAEVWKPFKTLTLPDGRRLDYHDMGPANGAPVLFSHMGYGLVRWHHPMVKLAFQLGLRVIVPIRAGYGQSDNLPRKADVLAATRADTVFLLDHLGIGTLPYASQGSDLLFAMDFARHDPHRISEIIGICARPCLPGDQHYAGMDKWHRFFISTAKHAPHLLNFTTKAVMSMTRRIGLEEMFRQLNKGSRADMALLEDAAMRPIMQANGELLVGPTSDISQAYTTELLVSESDWSDIVIGAKGTKTSFINGAEDPSHDMATIAEYREAYPWIDIDVVQNAGQMLIYQVYSQLIPRLAEAAKRAKSR